VSDTNVINTMFFVRRVYNQVKYGRIRKFP